MEGRQSSFSTPEHKNIPPKTILEGVRFFDANIHPAKKVVFFWQGDIRFEGYTGIKAKPSNRLYEKNQTECVLNRMIHRFLSSAD